MIIGQDISHHNSELHIMTSSDFIWIKATEGRRYVDDKLERHVEVIPKLYEKAGKELPVIGFYHFARPDNGNTPEDEARNFIDNIKPHVGQCLMALDIEGKALNCQNLKNWTDAFLDYVYENTKVRCFVYSTPDVLANRLRPYGNYPAWVAHWNVKTPSYRAWNMWQFTSKPFDIDIFNGTRAELATYALPGYH